MKSYRLYCFRMYLLTGDSYKGETENNGLAWVVNKVYESRKSWLGWYMFCDGHAQDYMNINIEIRTRPMWEHEVK